MSIPTPSLSPSETNYIISSLSDPTQPTRPDARSPLATRPIQISYGVFPQASGSARVNVGGTEVVAGVRLEVVDSSEEEGGWRGKVEVDVTPQAFPSINTQNLSSISTHLSSLLSTHFIPSISPFPILPGKKYFQPHLHLTLLSNSGSMLSTLVLASRAALSDLRIPKTKIISWTGNEDALETGDLSGIKAAIAGGGGKGGKRNKYVARGGEDWDLDLDDGKGVEYMKGREGLPVLVTLNLVPNSPNIFLDATPQEESACPTRLHLFFSSPSPSSFGSDKLKLCGLRLEGPEGLDNGRIKGLLQEGEKVAQELIQEINSSLPR
ncbi:hypothetical protein CI109_105660 [Kwoniella shandongensis]|uniref:Ribosomal RNA-processing protein 42 n=1 Tax=Kwoniella shandongensis TaxID=1734106 RepID=A0A5M6C5K8_9TREE|nr:uncharacterized protein CI109_003001 [Kwoniella shandongensis]KAA5528469.1 hypothetical protein CI109_003001 [Kwoniella shandongensis]